MEALDKRTIASGAEYDKYFPRAKGTTVLVKKSANVLHTAQLMRRTVLETLHHTGKIAPVLAGRNLSETCRNIYNFIYEHIQYEKDLDGVEQVRTPARSWADRVKGVDCDCYSVLISSVLTNLGIEHAFKIAKYTPSGLSQQVRDLFALGSINPNRVPWSHVYVVVWHKEGSRVCSKTGKRYFTIDPVNNGGYDAEVKTLDYQLHEMKNPRKKGLNGLPNEGERGYGMGYFFGTIALIAAVTGGYLYFSGDLKQQE